MEQSEALPSFLGLLSNCLTVESSSAIPLQDFAGPLNIDRRIESVDLRPESQAKSYQIASLPFSPMFHCAAGNA